MKINDEYLKLTSEQAVKKIKEAARVIIECIEINRISSAIASSALDVIYLSIWRDEFNCPFHIYKKMQLEKLEELEKEWI